MANATDIKFGVELETTMPVPDATPIGPYHAGFPVVWAPVPTTGETWRVERDRSIKYTPCRKAAEWVSPVLCGAEGLNNVRQMVGMIVARGGQVNASCGVHVTVEFNGDAAALARLVCLVANHEMGLYAASGSVKRMDGIYCNSVKNLKTPREAIQAHRYHVLNLTHMAMGRNRVEFRVFSGSLNAEKIASWIQLCVGLVQLSLEPGRACAWEQKREAGAAFLWGKKTLADYEISRLFYRLNWNKGSHAADAPQYGMMPGNTVEECKKHLRRLAVAFTASVKERDLARSVRA